MHNVILGDKDLLFLLVDPPLGKNRVEPILGLFLAVPQGGGFLEILSLDGSFFIDAMRARDPASSITSMALSGRKRPVR